MDTALHALSTFVAAHSAWAGPVLAVATFLESLVLIGAFVPATALMLLAGGLAAAGVLDPVAVLIWSATGAALGDAVSFSLGQNLGSAALRRPVFRPHRRAIARTRLFSRRYGVASIYLGRFFGPLRAFVPVMAGMLRMKTRSFQIANVASAFVWVAALVSPGYLAGKGLAVISHHDLGLILASVAGLVGLAAAAWILVRRAQPKPVTTVAPATFEPALLQTQACAA